MQSENKKQIIPVFYAADNNYLPYLAVALESLKLYKNKNYQYNVHILYTGDLGDNAAKVKAYEDDNLSVNFEDVTDKISRIGDFVHCRDYYTDAIYYRLFIPELFPQYDKAIYLDCDTVLLTDIAELYLQDIGDNYIGAVADQAVAAVPAFCEYTKNALGILSENYFNSGVIVMNLVQLRKIGFYQVFGDVLGSYDFIIAPDQDCLNLICKDKVYYYGAEWNRMPIGGQTSEKLKLVHYNLTMKPWHYDGILFSEYFWDFAKKTEFYDFICNAKASFSPAQAEADKVGSSKLIALAQSEADNPNNYIRTAGKNK